MNCADCRELLVGYIEGLLETQDTHLVEAHLKDCAACRAQLQDARALQQRLVANGAGYAGLDLENTVMNGIVRKQAFELRKTGENKQQKNFWRLVMKNRLAQLAAAAVIIIAVLAGIYFFTGRTPTVTCCAWADIVRPIMDAQTAELEIIIGEEGKSPVIHDMVMGSKIRRTMEGVEEAASIIDLNSGRILSLEHKNKKATYIDLKGMPQIPNYMDQLRNVITMLESSPHFVVEELGELVIDGRPLYGFRAKHPQANIVIYVDPTTALPVRIEQEGGQMKVICKNIRFDVPMDESLFSMDAPEGYKVEQRELDLLSSTEEDFIEGLRIQAEVLGDGTFPDDVSVEYYVKMTAALKDKFDKLQMTDDEKTALGLKLQKGLMFIRFFKGEGKWYYAGKGVKLGDADTPIFWYRPPSSQTWRVIYGDLQAKDVEEADLPEPVEKEAKEPIGYQQWDKDTFAGGEADQWHITADGNIVAHSYVTVTKGPQGASIMPVKLPYSDAVLESAALADLSLKFNQTGPGRYAVELPLEKMQAGETEIKFVWTLPLNRLEKTQYGFQTELASLIPVGAYKLTIVLDDGCGYALDDRDQSQFLAFVSGPIDIPRWYFGSCGILIQPVNK